MAHRRNIGLPRHSRAARRACSVALVASLMAGVLGAAPPASTGQEATPDEPGGTAEAAQADDARQVTQREAIEVVRYAGRDRTETAASIASDRTASGPGFGDDTVLLARADAFPDSLAGGYLAGVQQAPILLTGSQTLSSQATQYLQREQPDNVIILGGTNAISAGIAAELEADHRVLRVGGANRIETAAEIARYATPDQPQGLALLATAGEFPDALTASAVAAGENVPLLLTGGSELAQPTAEALDELAIDEVVIAGGPAAVGEGVRADLESRGITVTRAQGANRFATARAVAAFAEDRFDWADDHLNLASGTGFADAVAMAPHAGLEAGGPAPIALATSSGLPPATGEWMGDVAACDVTRLHIAGGTAAVSDAVADDAVDALTPDGGCADDGPPQISFTEPDAGATVPMEPDGITVAGTASDDETAVRRVELYADGELVAETVGDRGTDPLEWSVDVMPPEGDHTLRAVATDAHGQTGEATRDITVEAFDPGETVVRDDVTVVDDGLRDQLVDVGDDELVFDAPPGDVAVEPGDVLVGGVGPLTPEGLLRTVVVVVRDGDSTVVTTDGARMTDVFWQVDVSVDEPLTLEGAEDHTSDSVQLSEEELPTPIEPTVPQSATAGPRSEFGPSGSATTSADSGPGSATTSGSASTAAALAVGKEWTLDYAETFGGDPAELTVDGQLTFGFNFRSELKVETEFDWLDSRVYVDKFEVRLKVTEAARAAVEAHGEVDVGDEIDLGSIGLPNIEFTVGPVPVVITSDIDFTLHAEAAFEASGRAGASQEFNFTLGIRYTDANGWEPLNEQTNTFDLDPVEFAVAGHAEAGVEARLTSKLYGLAGPYFSLDPYTGVTLEGNPLLWELYFGLASYAGLEVDFPVVGSFETEYELFDLTTTIDTGEPEPDPEPVEVAIASPTGQTVGCCDVLLDAAVAHPRADGDQYVEWSSDVDGDLGWVLESDPGRATLSPGTHQLTATVPETVDGTEHEWTETVEVEVVGYGDGDEPQLTVNELGASDADAFALGLGLTEQLDLFRDPQFTTAPDDGLAPHGIAHRVPGMGSQVPVLTTGAAADVVSRNDGDDETGTALGGTNELGDSAEDTSVLAIDVDVPDWGDCLQFDFRFATEELPHYLGTEYNDAFLAQVTAEGGEPNWSVAASEVSGDSFARGPGELEVWVNNLGSYWVRSPAALETTFNEATPVMRAATPVSEGSHTLHLGLFDQGDATRDSAVFIQDLRVVDTDAGCVGGVAPGGLELTPVNS